jgi:hypothetical protein
MRFSLIFIAIFLNILTYNALALTPNANADTCDPSFQDVFNFEIGDVFQYREISTSSAGGSNATNEVVTQYIIRDKFSYGSTTEYYVQGWRKTLFYYANIAVNSIDTDTTSEEVYVDTILVFNDSANHFLNRCPKDLIKLDSYLLDEFGFKNLYSRKQTSYRDSLMQKVIGGDGNVLQYNDRDSLIPVSNMFYEAIYQKGIGLVSQEFTFFELRESLKLEGFLRNNDTTGFLEKGEYPDYSQASNLGSYKNVKPLLYPNPTRDVVYISGIENSITKVVLYSINGQKLYEDYITGNNFNVDHLESGTYITKIITSDGIFTSKLLLY